MIRFFTILSSLSIEYESDFEEFLVRKKYSNNKRKRDVVSK